MNAAITARLLQLTDDACANIRPPLSTAQRAVIASAIIEAHAMGEIDGIARTPVPRNVVMFPVRQ